ncbi:hypothetical protein E5K00_22010 [Hymenobacter aquaticus]|uniref:Outer membrane protein beta-barrel domain-containing protein n=1 Tax=Hymenobacter aquaticus TaxID=1867101 RepID=A0A4Z0PTP4_9BACT|nr:outer membrane beta-barrel protein [Hymenobacter aquaticus]TGE20669.1 hypothetical protein E5K00_22010 [Hymenobacter aquaticus]
MKQFICVAALLCGSALTAHAQTTAGKLLLGGSLGFSSTKYTPDVQKSFEQRQFQFNIAPKIGYFLADNWAVGLQTGFNHSKQTNTDPYGATPYTYDQKRNGYQVGPFVRYYQMLGEKAGFFGQLTALYSRAKGESSSTTDNTATYDEKSRSYSATLTPGFVFFPTDKLGLELSLGNLGYFATKDEVRDTQTSGQRFNRSGKSSGFGADFTLGTLMLGASLYLGR